MELTRNMKVLVVIAIIVGASLPLVLWLAFPQQSPIDWTITLYVDEGEQVNVTYQEITNTSLYTTFTNQHLVTIKYVSQNIDKDGLYTGISIWDLIQQSGINYSTANHIRFEASDGWMSPAIPLSLIESAGSLAAIVYDRVGGWHDLVEYGPLMPIINHSVTDSITSTRYSVKNFTKIIFETYNNWNLTIFGDFAENNATFSLGQVMTSSSHWSRRVTNEIFNYTDVGGTSELRNFTGISVWDLFDRNTIIENITGNAIRFVAEDGNKSKEIPLTTVEDNTTKVAIVWTEDGVPLGSSNGYLMGVLDFTLFPLSNSSEFWTEKVVGIEFFFIV